MASEVRERAGCAYPGCTRDLGGLGDFCACPSCGRPQFRCSACRSTNRAHATHCTRCAKPISHEDLALAVAKDFQGVISAGTNLAAGQTGGYVRDFKSAKVVRSPFVCLGLVFLELETASGPGGRTGYRLVVLDPKKGGTIAKLELPDYLVGHAAAPDRSGVLMATPEKLLCLDLDARPLKLEEVCGPPGPGQRFIRSPVFADGWYLATAAGGARPDSYRLHRLNGQAGRLVEFGELPGRPEVLASVRSKVVALGPDGGIVASEKGVKPLQPKQCPGGNLGEECFAFDGRRLWYVSANRVAYYDCQDGGFAVVPGLEHTGVGRLAVSRQSLIVTDGERMWRQRAAQMVMGEPPAVIQTGNFATRAACFGPYVAATTPEGTLVIVNEDHPGGEGAAERPFVKAFKERELAFGPVFFDGFLYLAARYVGGTELYALGLPR